MATQEPRPYEPQPLLWRVMFFVGLVLQHWYVFGLVTQPAPAAADGQYIGKQMKR